MTNAWYDKGREAFGNGAINYPSDTIKAVAVTASAYTPNLATDQFLSDIPGGARKATATLTTKTNVAGVFDADDLVFSAVAAFGSGGQIDYVALYKDTGAAGTSPLMGLIDTATNLPVVTNGGDINVAWSNGASKIAKL